MLISVCRPVGCWGKDLGDERHPPCLWRPPSAAVLGAGAGAGRLPPAAASTAGLSPSVVAKDLWEVLQSRGRWCGGFPTPSPGCEGGGGPVPPTLFNQKLPKIQPCAPEMAKELHFPWMHPYLLIILPSFFEFLFFFLWFFSIFMSGFSPQIAFFVFQLLIFWQRRKIYGSKNLFTGIVHETSKGLSYLRKKPKMNSLNVKNLNSQICILKFHTKCLFWRIPLTQNSFF